MQTAFARKIVVLGTNQTKIAVGRSVANQGNKGRPFPLSLPGADNSVNSAEKYRKITKISPGTYFLKALFEGLIYGGKVAFQNRLG